jgi:quinol monooxygenase YgiN
MYRLVWEFEAKPEALAEFEDVYGPEGRWVSFFRQSPDYVASELFVSVTHPHRFVTVDTWRSRSTYESFRKTHAQEYAALDEWCERLTAHERTLGVTDDGR